MRNILIGSLLMSTAAFTVPALAQDTPAPAPGQTAPSHTAPPPAAPETPVAPVTPATPVTPPAAEMAPPANPPAVVPVTDANVLSSNLVGLNVSNAGNETVGSIRDLVLDDDNALTGVIVSVGGFLGLGEHYVVLEPDSINVTYDEENRRWEARVNATADELKAAPAFTYEGKFGN